MPVTTYISSNGMLIGERTGTGPRIDYVPDALGNIIAAVDQNLNTTYTAQYKPYGGVLASTGTAPNFTFVGALNYNTAAGRPYADFHAGRRIGSTTTGRWTSVDPLWPIVSPYAYSLNNPLTYSDPSGLSPRLTINDHWGGCQNLGCEVANWTIEWIVSDAPPTYRGWIVQHMSFNFGPKICWSGATAIEKNCQPSDDYYERWLVVGTKVYAESGPGVGHRVGDGWTPIGPMSPCTYGKTTITGFAKLMTAPLPGNWARDGQVGNNTCAVGLPTTGSVPGWQDASAQVSRKMTLTWSCCQDISMFIPCYDPTQPTFSKAQCSTK